MLPMEARSKEQGTRTNLSKDKFKQRHVANGSKEQIEARTNLSKDMLPMEARSKLKQGAKTCCQWCLFVNKYSKQN
jgi:hypothetical protein